MSTTATRRSCAVSGAHAVYTDTWISMGQEKEARSKRVLFAGYRVDAALMAKAREDAVFLHCLPAHRGDEVTDEVMDSESSLVFTQAGNRLPTQQALIAQLLLSSPDFGGARVAR